MLVKNSVDYTTLPDLLFSGFKEHLRILHDDEDDSIKSYLASSMDAISTYSDNDIFITEYETIYVDLDYSFPSSLYGWYTGKNNINDVVITDSDSVDVTSDYTIDNERGIIYPHPLTNTVSFNCGYSTVATIPPNLKNIIYRLGADFFENREANRIGEPKALPLWVEYSMASIWKARV